MTRNFSDLQQGPGIEDFQRPSKPVPLALGLQVWGSAAIFSYYIVV